MLNQSQFCAAAFRSHRDTGLPLSVAFDVVRFLADKTASDAVSRNLASPGFTSLHAARLYDVSRDAAFTSICTGFVHRGVSAPHWIQMVGRADRP